MNQEEKIKEVLTRGVENIYPNPQALEKKLKSGQKIRLYCGFDPTAPTLHIGNAIQIRKLAQFQALGHEVIFLLGDFTGMIGDPTDKTATRKKLTRKEALKNAKNYKKQASKILKFSGKNPAKFLYNSQWGDKLSFADLIELTSNFTVQQIIVRDMFQERLKRKKPIYLHEFLYPVAQAYDSVAMSIDLEVGGNDQTFNMLCGRDLIKALKNKEKFVLTTKLLVDSSGQKVGKTEGKIVNLDIPSAEMFGQIMSWSDEVISLGLELCTDLPIEEVNQINQQIKENRINPRDAKARLAREIVAIHHSKPAALKAEKEFNKIFKDKEKPTDIPIFKAKPERIKLIDLLIESKLAPSKSEARRLIEQGGVKIDNRIIKDPTAEIIPKNNTTLQVGKRNFIQIKV